MPNACRYDKIDDEPSIQQMLIIDNWYNSFLKQGHCEQGWGKKPRIWMEATLVYKLWKIQTADLINHDSKYSFCELQLSVRCDIRVPAVPVFPTWGGSVPIQQVVIFGGVKVHDNTGSIKQLLVTAGTGDAVVTVPGVSSVIQLLRLHLAMHPSPGWQKREKEKEGRWWRYTDRVCPSA